MHKRWLLVLLLAVAAWAQDTFDAGRSITAIAPTPTGDGHLGRIETGGSTQVRFALPKDPPLGLLVNLGNIVGFTGRGTSYQLVLRRDAADGPVIYEGPVIANGDAWNADNQRPIDLTKAVTPADGLRGYLDIFITPVVKEDGWTLYKDSPGRHIAATLVEDTPAQRAAREEQRQAQARGIRLLPAPQRMTLSDGDLKLTARSRIMLPRGAGADDLLAATDLAQVIQERCGLALTVAEGQSGAGDIALEGSGKPLEGGPEGYRVGVTDRVVGTGATPAARFYAGATIGQLITADGRLPHVAISDWPAFPLRGLQYDVARGQTVVPEWWERVIRTLARWKLNAIMIYGENDYAFRQFPFLGRPGTFTPEKAKRLSAYAARYHVELIPQFESLGHASAVLSAKELEPIREAGGSWVYCTSNAGTWEFLNKVFDELCEQFPGKYLHVGADEFESGFGLCPLCKAKVAKVGLGGLYAEHMNKLNELCKKHGRTMLFWPSHSGPTPDLSWMTVKNEAQLQKDCIPTEWIYHGPAAYPELEQYQKLGFQDVWASAAVVCFSQVWPDYPTTYRGIRGFLRAGIDRGIKGGMTTTWEWMHGGLVANSLLGMGYTAECSWSGGKTSVSDFERRYAGDVFGVADPDGQRIHTALAVPWPQRGPAAMLANQHHISEVLFAAPETVRRSYALKLDMYKDVSAPIEALDASLDRVAKLKAEAKANADLLDYATAGLGALRHALRKVQVMGEAAADYRAARKEADPAKIRAAAAKIRGLKADMAFAETYRKAAADLGAAQYDVDRLDKLAAAYEALAAKLDALADDVAAKKVTELPPPATFGLETGKIIRLGEWEPKQMSEQACTLTYALPTPLPAESFAVEWEYARGAHGLRIHTTQLLNGDQVIAEDKHEGWAGGGSNHNVYQLKVPAGTEANAKLSIRGEAASSGGTDSLGEVWLLIED